MGPMKNEKSTSPVCSQMATKLTSQACPGCGHRTCATQQLREEYEADRRRRQLEYWLGA